MNEREAILRWLRAGLEAVEPERLTRDCMKDRTGPLTVLAIGKAAPAMCRGAAVVGDVEGLCIASHPEPVPDGIELVIGDHPLPGGSSLEAGLKAIEISSRADVALISGGGSSLCEVPADGITIEFVADVHQRLLDSGIGIADINHVRAHLSKVKGGGLGPIPTFVLSDVADARPEVVSSGPTFGVDPDPERALRVMRRAGITVVPEVEDVIRSHYMTPRPVAELVVLADGQTAARGAAQCVEDHIPARAGADWIVGDLRDTLAGFIDSAEPGVTVSSGEPWVELGPRGRGGRNTHAALVAATMIEGSDTWFAALATDGVDGRSGAAGAIVHGSTVSRGGDPTLALENFDSGTYLEATGDLIDFGPTGTNVADLWLIWKPEDGPEPILSV